MGFPNNNYADNGFADKHFKLPQLAGRRGARILAMFALYQFDLTGYSCAKIMVELRTNNDVSKLDEAYFERVTTCSIAQIKQLDESLTSALDRDFNQLTPIECAILRLATWELINCAEIPYKVIINEAIEISKIFGTNDGYKYINGILNRLIPTYRSHD